MEGQIAVVVRAGAADHHGQSAHGRQRVAHGGAGASASQDQHLFSGEIKAGPLYHAGKTETVGAVSEKSAVRTPDKRVDASCGGGHVTEFVTERDHGLLIGDGHVQTRPGPLPQEIFQLLRLFFVQFLFIFSVRSPCILLCRRLFD